MYQLQYTILSDSFGGVTGVITRSGLLIFKASDILRALELEHMADEMVDKSVHMDKNGQVWIPSEIVLELCDESRARCREEFRAWVAYTVIPLRDSLKRMEGVFNGKDER